jgi:flagellar basal-body rod protein FlgB
MELGNIPLFQLVKKRLSWLGQRHELVSQNTANADTPKYRARDIKPFNFREVLRQETRPPLNMQMTTASHLPGVRKRASDFGEGEVRKPYETAIDGNSVVLEEQMAKENETAISHRLTTELYKKHLGMIKAALGKGR